MIFTFIPEPRDAQEAAFQGRIMDRAKTLLADGYQLQWGRDLTNLFNAIGDDAYNYCTVLSPEGKMYVVNMLTQECDCKCCKKHHYCKHLIGVLLEDDRLHDEALVAEFEARGYTW